MFELAIGIVLGALFSPFWMKLFNMAKAYVTGSAKTAIKEAAIEELSKTDTPEK